jgi:Asp/Glu/hydantoin racemase
MSNNKEIQPVVGVLAAASVTASTAGTAITLVTCTRDHKLLLVPNTLNQDCMLTYNGADLFPLLSGLPAVIDLRANELDARAARVVGIYHLGVAPTTGRVGATLL